MRQATKVLHSEFRHSDVLDRIGGDEFAILVPATDSATVEQIVSRIRTRIQERKDPSAHLSVQLSLSAATAERSNLNGTLTLADQRMYADKSARQSSTPNPPAA